MAARATPAAMTRIHAGTVWLRSLRGAEHPREDAGADPGEEAERERGGEILEGERWACR